MKEFIEKLIERLEEKFKYNSEQAEIYRDGSDKDVYFREKKDLYMDRANTYGQVMRIVNQLAEEYNNGWIPCNEVLPPQPKANPIFENKPLELYLVTVKNTEYSFRAFWNGKIFTDGWIKLDVIAWMPLPAPYKKGE